ncbi:hypothetical protein PEC301877_18270 [Pectobacterium carotovorum subsp. carotovorum]|nr:hypothetical protein PEC301877_18270 [Pectobacterium carotovorum subsp. carotovorum]
MLEKLFNIETLVSLSFCIYITIKVLRININNKNQTINGGSGNSINNVNIELKGDQKDFKSLWNVLAILVLVSFPFFYDFYVSTLVSLSIFGWFFCLIGCVIAIKTYGVSRTIDLIYIPLTMFVGVLCYLASLFIIQNNYSYDNFYLSMLNLASNFNFSKSYFDYVIRHIPGISAFIGFPLIFVSLLYSTFAFVMKRSFDGAIRHAVFCLGSACIGYVLASSLLIAIYNQKNQYMMEIIKAPLYIILNLF